MSLGLDTITTGDATKLLASLPARSVDLLLTDPPFGNGEGTSYGIARRKILGDEHPLVGLHALAVSYRLLRANRVAFIFCGAKHLGFIESFIRNYTGFRIREHLIWDKGSPGLGRNYRRSFEAILALEKGRPSYRATLPTVLAASRVRATLHPHTKPQPLLARLIEATTDPGQVVLDPFAGSGAICLAAKRLGRHFVGIELDPGYATIARQQVATSPGEAA